MNITKVIEFLISGVIIVRGGYFAYAFITPGLDDAVLASAVGYPFIMLIIGMFMVIPGIVTIAGNMRDSMVLKNIGLFAMSLCFTFIAILHMLSDGTRPFSWIYPIALAFISGAVWLHNRTFSTGTAKLQQDPQGDSPNE